MISSGIEPNTPKIVDLDNVTLHCSQHYIDRKFRFINYNFWFKKKKKGKKCHGHDF